MVRHTIQFVINDPQKLNLAEMGFLKHGFSNQTELDELHQCQWLL